MNLGEIDPNTWFVTVVLKLVTTREVLKILMLEVYALKFQFNWYGILSVPQDFLEVLLVIRMLLMLRTTVVNYPVWTVELVGDEQRTGL